MNLGQIWRRKPQTPPSHFVPALDRVREMREHSGWEPVTGEAVIQQRAERVAAAREHVVIPPFANERKPQATSLSRGVWLRDLLTPAFAAAAGFLGIVLTGVLLERSPTVRLVAPPTVYFHITQPYDSLSDSVAQNFARKALVAAGYDLRDWVIIRSSGSQDPYVNRISSNEGFIAFQRNDATLRVNIRFEPGGGRIACTISK